MGYPEQPAPGLSPLEDRHQLQRHAHSLGYVAVPERLWERIKTTLRMNPGSFVLWRDVLNQQEVIERER